MIDFDSFADDVLSTDAFAQEVVYTPSGGQWKTIKAVFENAFIAMEGIGDVGVSSSVPSVLCKASDVADAARGDTVIVDETTYYITEGRPDGDGFMLMFLSKDA